MSILKWMKSYFKINTLFDCVGIDISTSAIKFAQLKPNSYTVNQYLIQDIPIIKGNNIDKINEISSLLKQYWSNRKFKYKHVALALQHSSVITRTIQTPMFVNKIDLDIYVKNQLENLFDVDIDTVDFDYSILKNNYSEIKNQNVLVVIAKKEKIEEIQALTELAKFDLGAIYIECYVLYNLFCSLAKTHQISLNEHSCLFLDVGIGKLKVLLIHNEELAYFNEVSTKLQSEKLISNDVLALDSQPDSGVVDADNKEFTEVVEIIVTELMRHLQLAKSQILIESKISIDTFDKVFISGGLAYVPGLISNLNALFNLEIIEIASLLKQHNPHMSKNDLSRLITSIALARDKYND